MVRGLFEIRKENEKRLQEHLTHYNHGKAFHVSTWHSTFIVMNKRLLAVDEYSLRVLNEKTSEEWRAEHASPTIYETPHIDFFR
jgi:hypothetical protein